MQKVSLRVTRVTSGDGLSPLFAPYRLAGGFLVGIMFGFLVGTLFGEQFSRVSVSPSTQLGAAGTALTAPEDNREFQTVHLDQGVAESPAAIEIPESAEVFAAQSETEERTAALARRNALDILIADRELALSQLGELIERTKNASITIVADFNRSCGNWKDSCALSYASELEQYNAAYNDLEERRSALEKELGDARDERALLPQ